MLLLFGLDEKNDWCCITWFFAADSECSNDQNKFGKSGEVVEIRMRVGLLWIAKLSSQSKPIAPPSNHLSPFQDFIFKPLSSQVSCPEIGLRISNNRKL